MKKPFPFPAKPVIQNGKLLDLPIGWLHRDIPSWYQYTGRDITRTFIATYTDLWKVAIEIKASWQAAGRYYNFSPL